MNILDFTYDGVHRAGFGYDANGNVTNDPLRGFEMSYNLLNLASQVRWRAPGSTGQNSSVVGETVYYADGTRAGVVDPENGYWTARYIGSLIYHGESGEESLDGIQTGDGYIDCHGGDVGDAEMQYFLRDHLGSVRVVASDRNTVLRRSDYLPFGVRMEMDDLQQGVGRSGFFGFSGKENEMWPSSYGSTGVVASPVQSILHWELGERYQHFGARAYDPLTCTFMQTDPLAEKYYGVSPYAYCGNNPVMFVDPDGLYPVVFIETKNLGHAFIATINNNGITVFTYGRTGFVPDYFHNNNIKNIWPFGEGVLTIYKNEDAIAYLNDRIAHDIHYSIFVFDGDDEMISEYYNDLFEKGSLVTEGKSAGNPCSRVVSQYNLAYNNCVTTTLRGLAAGKIDVVSERGTLFLSPAETISEIVKSNKAIETYFGDEAKEFINGLQSEE